MAPNQQTKRPTFLPSLSSWESLLGLLVIVTVIVSTVTTSGFADSANISASIALMSEKSLMVLPLVPLIIMREIDISVASMAGLSSVAAGMTLQSGHSLPVAVIVALLVGGACGAFNGLCVILLGMPSLVVTLGTLALYRGLCYVLLGGAPTTVVPQSLTDFGNNSLPGGYLPLAIVPFLILAPLCALVLHGLPVGRRIYAIGGNPQTARYSGIHTQRLRFLVFLASGLVCAIAGIISIGRTSSASPDGLTGYELDAITVVFLGGVSVLGGKGRVSGVVWALVLLICLRSVLQLHNVSAYAQGTAVGVLLITSLLVSNATHSLGARWRDRSRRRLRRTESPAVPL